VGRAGGRLSLARTGLDPLHDRVRRLGRRLDPVLGGDRAEVSPRRDRLLGPSAVGPLAIAVSAVGAIAIGRLTIANAVIRRLRAQEIEIASLKVGTLEVGGQRWPETAGASEPRAVAPSALGTPVGPGTPDMPEPTMGTAGDVAATSELGGAGAGA
jgi:hypothetical protein